MTRWPASQIRRFVVALVALTLTVTALAASLAVYPFLSDDPDVGLAVADEIAASFYDTAYVFGPEISPSLVPPLVVVEGFVNLGRVLDVNDWTGAAGAGLIRDGAGVDVAVTGTLAVDGERAVLQLQVAYAAGTRTVELTAAAGDRGRLVRQAVLLLAPLLGAHDTPPVVASPPIVGGYAGYVQGLGLASVGLLDDAYSVTQDALATVQAGVETTWAARAEELYLDLQAVLDGDLLVSAEDTKARVRRQARRAFLGLSLFDLQESGVSTAFSRLANVGALGAANAWMGVLAVDAGNEAAATAAFERANTPDYPYAVALLASAADSVGDAETAGELIDSLVEPGARAGSATLVGASLVALLMDNHDRQVATLKELMRVSPFLAYAPQELSFLAFDRGDALAAAEALSVAVELDPYSNLFWTNLGWARYLLGFLDSSEAASKRALALDADQYIAAYNLGLVRAVTGRLESALEAYAYATDRDPTVDDAAIDDLLEARVLYPGVPAVEYALGTLYEAKGMREPARTAYRRYVAMLFGSSDESDAPYAAEARARIERLSQPLPPLELSPDVTVRLGRRGPSGLSFHPGDPLRPVFELVTPGDQLPARVDVTVTLTPAGADAEADPSAVATAVVDPPGGAVGYVVDTVELRLPSDLPTGSYTLGIAVAAEDLSAETELTVAVEGRAEPLRQLIALQVVMTGLEVETPLYGADDLGNPGKVTQRLLTELRDSAGVADAALPTIETGRFAGLGGRELFESATLADVEEFLEYLASTGTRETRFTFVDGFAQWALDGAPEAE